MDARELLGAADVDERTLAAMVADHLGVSDVELLTCDVEIADYDIESLTTAGRYHVRGAARHIGGTRPYAFFVKVVQSWARTPQFRNVPEHLRAVAAASLPWRNEPAVYRSDLALRLPAGLSMPRAHRVLDLDDESAAVWLDLVDADPTPWATPTFDRAAYLLGRLAAGAAVQPLARLGTTAVVSGYVHGRLQHQVVPALRSGALWAHPAVAAAFGPALRASLLAAVDVLPQVVKELEGAPLGAAHGDACPRNLLVPRDRTCDFVVIDFAFWCEAPLGFDVSQLLLGEVQLGERPAAELPELEQVCLAAYVRGLRDEGCEVPTAAVRRCIALTMLLFFALSAAPIEVLFGAPTPGSAQVLRERAAAAAFVLDLVAETAPA